MMARPSRSPWIPGLLAVCALGAAPRLQAQVPTSEYVSRRDALMAQLDSGAVVAFGAREPTRHWPSFSQLPAFHYLTGYDEPDAALLIVKRGGAVTSALFTTAVDPISEIFNGRRATASEVLEATGLIQRAFTQLRPALDSLVGTLPLYVVSDIASPDFAGRDTLTYGRGFVAAFTRAHAGTSLRSADSLVAALRARKSTVELALLRRAAEISDAGHIAGLCAVKPGSNEYQVQAALEYIFREKGADGPGYASIVGSGVNGTTLHYDRDDRTMKSGDLVVIDAAAQYRGYSADVTRTAPVSGSFTPDQRAIYQLVRDAQAAAERQAKPGALWRTVTDSSSAILAAGLAKLGLIESPTATFDAPWTERCQRTPAACTQRFLFMPHGLGHGIGLDVHDPAQFYTGGVIRPGDAFTIEPGIYVRPTLLDNLPDTPRNRAMIARLRPVVERFKGIGVRIEDDYIVTPGAVERISRAPREIAEVEAATGRGCARPPLP